MKQINEYINERLKISSDLSKYSYHPNNRKELIDILQKLILFLKPPPR